MTNAHAALKVKADAAIDKIRAAQQARLLETRLQYIRQRAMVNKASIESIEIGTEIAEITKELEVLIIKNNTLTSEGE